MTTQAQSLFRSEDMKFVQLTMTEATAHSTMTAIGQIGVLHLNDLGSAHAEGGANAHEAYLHYKKRVANCFYWEKKLQTMREAMRENGIVPPPVDHAEQDQKQVTHPDVLHAIAGWLEPIEEQLTQNVFFKKQQTQRINEQTERSYVLEKCKDLAYVRRQGAGDAKVSAADLELAAMGVGPSKDQKVAGGSAGAAAAAAAADLERGGMAAALAAGKFTANVCGVISVDRQAFFERMLFRVSRGNAMATFMPIEDKISDPLTNEEVSKTVFTVVFVGEQLRNRIVKICAFCGATIVPVPTDAVSYDMELKLIGQRLDEYSGVLTRTKDDIYKILAAVAYEDGKVGRPDVLSPIVQWEKALSREKAVCDALRKCDWPRGSDVVYAEGYVPADDADRLTTAVDAIRKSSPECVCEIANLERWHSPPTFFRVNKYTDPFQSIVNTYGWPRYKEANPGLFTIFTFPFLFGVMYGDIGHGTALTLFALYLIWKEDELEKKVARKELGEIFPMAFGGRYLLVGMGICAVYCGIMYNDCFSIPWNVYGSVWRFPEWEEGQAFREAAKVGYVYPVGVDPSWYGTTNELTFFNSMKMKLSVTLGVTHMVFGLFLQLSNHLYNRDMLGVFCEFLPQLLFMLCTFGYMVLLILIKLSTDWSMPGRISPPNLIQTMIAMFLNVGTVEPSKQLYEGQAGFQTFLVLVALLSVPVMLLVRPCYEHYQNTKLKQRTGGISAHHDGADAGADAESGHGHTANGDDVTPEPLHDDGDEKAPASHGAKLATIDEKSDAVGAGGDGKAHGHGGGGGGGHGHGGEEVTFGDLFIHQTIHTIEFVLGAVSNTASYLRLWALSLAHAELSTVFWDKMLLQYGIYTTNPVMVVVGFAVWAGATVAVLMSMDVLECFLHALRLHWVEFQNKFFHADGYAFQPFDFAAKPQES